MNYNVVSWWSGGITSAITCKLCIDLFGIDNVDFIFIDTFNEDDDTYRFKKDCEEWYGKEIETITGIGEKYTCIQDVWRKHKSLNVAKGAICSAVLKRDVRLRWETNNTYNHQAFGFDFSEHGRASGIHKNYPKSKPIFPLLMYGYSKKDCGDILLGAGLQLPRMYGLKFQNNNCGKTLCVQGGIGYWQMARDMGGEWLEKYNNMADIEHEFTDIVGKPVTMLKDQSKEAKERESNLVFLKPHPDYPHVKDISMMSGREPKPLFECNGFCATNDLEERNETEQEINYQTTLEL